MKQKNTVYEGTPLHKQFEQTERQIEIQKQKEAKNWKDQEKQGQSGFRKLKKVGKKGF